MDATLKLDTLARSYLQHQYVCQGYPGIGLAIDDDAIGVTFVCSRCAARFDGTFSGDDARELRQAGLLTEAGLLGRVLERTERQSLN